MRYYILKKPAIWLTDSILTHNSRTRTNPIKDGDETSITILVFILDCFQEKLQNKLFQNSKKKKLILVQFGSFLPKFGQKWIFLGKWAVSFLNIPIAYQWTKNVKKLISHFQEKCWANWWIDRWSDRKEQGQDRVQ